LKFNRLKEKYFVVQLFGSDPAHFAVATRLVTQKIKPDGIDINFGCPVPKIYRQGAGCGLMKDLKQARAVIETVLANTNLPVSLKLRTKVGEVGAAEFLKNISDLPVAAIMIHGRTYAQGFAGAPDWRSVKAARKYFKGVIIANGGINDLASAQKALKESRADGLGLARGVLGRPWLFKEIKTGKKINLLPKQIFKIALNQAAMEQEQKGKAGIIELRKHLAWYAAGLTNAAKLRSELVRVTNLKKIENIFTGYLKNL
jgi:tRNA-dihydrouridine synthase B